MAITYELVPEHRLVRARFIGAVPLAEVGAFVAAVNADPDYRPDFDMVFDVREVTTVWDTEQIRSYARGTRSRGPEETSRRAFIVDDDVKFGLVRLFEAHAEGSPTQYRVFRKMADAAEWLERDPATLDPVVTNQVDVEDPIGDGMPHGSGPSAAGR